MPLLRRYDKADADITITVIKEHAKKFGYTPIDRKHTLTIYWGILEDTLQIFQYYNDESEFDSSLYSRSGAFYYDEEPNWHDPEIYAAITSININNPITPTSLGSFFKNFYNVTEFTNLTNLQTEKIKNFDSTFMNCRSLISLDLSSFKTSSALTTANMFDSCINLEHIYVNKENWSLESLISSTYMFKDTYFLHNYIGVENSYFAIIDNGTNNGYLEEKPYLINVNWGVDALENPIYRILELSMDDLDPNEFIETGVVQVLYTDLSSEMQKDITNHTLILAEGGEMKPVNYGFNKETGIVTFKFSNFDPSEYDIYGEINTRVTPNRININKSIENEVLDLRKGENT